MITWTNSDSFHAKQVSIVITRPDGTVEKLPAGVNDASNYFTSAVLNKSWLEGRYTIEKKLQKYRFL